MPIDLSPVANSWGVFFGGEAKNAVFAVSRKQGRTLWRFDIRHPSLIGIASGAVVVQASGKLVGIKASNGKQLWSRNLDVYAFALKRNRLFACTDIGVYVMSSTNGKLRNRIKGSCKGQVVVDDSAIFYFDGKRILARGTSGKRIIWSHSVKGVVGMAVAGTNLYVACRKSVYLFNKRTGHLIRSRNTQTGYIQSGPYLSHSCALIVKRDQTAECLGDVSRK